MKSPETRNSLGESDTHRSDAILFQSEVDQRRESRLSVNVRSLGDRNAEELRLGMSPYTNAGQMQGQGRTRVNSFGRQWTHSR